MITNKSIIKKITSKNKHYSFTVEFTDNKLSMVSIYDGTTNIFRFYTLYKPHVLEKLYDLRDCCNKVISVLEKEK